MRAEIGTEAAQFPEKEYINEIFLAVCLGFHGLDFFSQKFVNEGEDAWGEVGEFRNSQKSFLPLLHQPINI
jgi:hypothetical protein